MFFIALFSACLIGLSTQVKEANYEWKHLEPNEPVPSNAITGGVILEAGNDDPGLNVFVARKKINGLYRIGKLYDPIKTGKWLAFFLIDGAERPTPDESLEVSSMNSILLCRNS